MSDFKEFSNGEKENTPVPQKSSENFWDTITSPYGASVPKPEKTGGDTGIDGKNNNTDIANSANNASDFGGNQDGMSDASDFGGDRSGMSDASDFGGNRSGVGNASDFGGNRDGVGNASDFGGNRSGMSDSSDFGGNRSGVGNASNAYGNNFGSNNGDGINWNQDNGMYHGRPGIQDDFRGGDYYNFEKKPDCETEIYNDTNDDRRETHEADGETRKADGETREADGDKSEADGENHEADEDIPVVDEEMGYTEKDTIPNVSSGKVVFWPLLGVMLVICTIVSIYIARKYSSGMIGFDESGSGTTPSHEYTSSVVEHIDVEEPKEEIYTDKVALYNEAQKSCVSVICTIETKVFGSVTTSYSLGSGFVVSEEGYIVTNAHVVDGAKSYKVRFYNGKEYDAILVGKDEICDLAVVKIRADEKLYPASIGDSDDIRVGDFAMAIGTPSSADLFGTMTFGVISGKERKLEIENQNGQVVRTLFMIQTDATLNPGNSGGPLFNMYGQVIGINTMKLVDDYEGMGFAIPTSGALPIINSLISTGNADYNDSGYVKGGAQIGIEGRTLTEEVKEEYNFSSSAPEGVLIVTIQKLSAAYKAGVNAYDIITEFNGEKITDIEQLAKAIREFSPGETVKIKVYREKAYSSSGEYLEYTFALDAVED